MNFKITQSLPWQRTLAIFTAAVVASFGLVVIPQQSADARTRTNVKVTICHRTHATTNPYRKITVSSSAVDGPLNPSNPSGGNPSAGDHAGYDHNAYAGNGNNNRNPDQGTHSVTIDVNGVPTAVRVFDPSFNYPANNKVWEDIIPPFKTDTYSFPGLNWNDLGKAIYYGLTYNGRSYAGLCNETGAKEFADAEYASWLADNPGASDNQKNAKKRDIIGDLREQEAEGDPQFSNGGDFTELPAPKEQKPKGPNKPSRFTTLLNNTAANNKQALAGVVWKDMNQNGVQDAGEDIFSNVNISVIDPQSGTELSQLGLPSSEFSLVSYSTSVPKSRKFTFANFTGNRTFRSAVSTYTITTDANGYFEVPLLPDGEWQVVVTTPAGWSYTYDSSGTNDGNMPGTIVPAGGVGFAWAGLVYTGPAGSTVNPDGTITLPDGTVVNADGTVISAGLANTGMNSSWYVAGVIALQLIALGGILMWLRRRNESR